MGCIPRKKREGRIGTHHSIQSIRINKSLLVTNSEEQEIKIRSSNMIKKVNTSVESRYKIIGTLGKGSFGKVMKTLDLKTGLFRAMKIISKDSLEFQDDEKQFLKEIEILKQTDHPNIIQIYEYFEDILNYFVVTEFISGGDLYDTITKWNDYNEYKACYIMHQIISAVLYLHSKNIVHRDLKPENILIEGIDTDSNKEFFNVKLIDFGTSNYLKENSKFSVKMGTPYYIAPEVIKKKYNEKCDLWSCGVIMYVLLTGHPPFNGIDTDEIFKQVLEKKIDFSCIELKNFSFEAKDLLKKLLTVDPNQRISAEEAIEHDWFSKMDIKKHMMGSVNESNAKSILHKMKFFNSKEKFQQATIAYIVHFISTNEELKDLKKLFKILDTSGDGRLNIKELKEGFEKYYGKCLTEYELEKIMLNLDQDRNGYIEYEEFLRVAINHKTIMSERNLKFAFDSFDKNKDGKLTSEEIKSVLGTTGKGYVNELISIIDSNKDGDISFSEFAELMRKVVLNSTTINEKMEKFFHK
jgi:calcium-dependent protein kinase